MKTLILTVFAAMALVLAGSYAGTAFATMYDDNPGIDMYQTPSSSMHSPSDTATTQSCTAKEVQAGDLDKALAEARENCPRCTLAITDGPNRSEAPWVEDSKVIKSCS